MKLSLKGKTILLIASIGVLISAVAILVFYRGIRRVITTEYESESTNIARLAAVEVDLDKLLAVKSAVLEIYENADNKVLSDQWGTPEFDAYVGQFAEIENMEEYQSLREDLRRMQDVIDVNCLYITWLDRPNEMMVYLVDAAYEDPCPPGCIDPVYDLNSPGLQDVRMGFPPNITNTPEYGWIVATGMPIVDGQDQVVAFAAVDMSMNEIMTQQRRFLLYIALGFLLLTVIVCLIGIRLVDRFIVSPINKLSDAAEHYSAGNQGFSGIEIHTGDEIEILASSMLQMDQDITNYIDELVSANEHAERMEHAANIDAMTKVRNKRAYDIKASQLSGSAKDYGLVMIDLNSLKQINDSYGHDKGDVAIKTICGIVCRVFKHSPVYRIGGDEFVVILEHDDFDEREALIGELNDALRRIAEDTSLSPWEQASAAVGYAVFDPLQDDGVESVFQRADEAMYQRKKEMKGI